MPETPTPQRPEDEAHTAASRPGAIPVIETRELSYSYGDGEHALHGISFSVPAHEKVVLLGSNGCGKSTLLRILNGLLFADEGDCLYRGVRLDKKRLRTDSYSRDFRRRVVLLFQNPDAMLFNPSVYDEIAYGLRQLARSEEDAVDNKVKRWAELLGIEKILDRPPFKLSGGEKQKVCLAALLALEPELLLLDEPTANLDPRSSGWFIDFLQELDVTAVIATHNLSLAGELGDRILLLSEDHRLIFDGDIDELMKDRDALEAANLLHSHKTRRGAAGERGPHSHDWS